MNAIKLPVTATSSGIFVDAEGKWVQSDDVAAALNAAPTRVFEGLTLEVLGAIFESAEKDSFQTPGFGPDECHAWRKAVLAALQAFAAPQAPQWQPISSAPMDGTIILLYSREAEVCFGRWSENPDIEWLASSNGLDSVSFPKDAFTHWMPLPAAPEAQGGENG